MAQRLSKKPLSEGFDLWDRGYNLGAMRLFIFKAETSPPFQLGPCLDAIGHLLLALEEFADARENFGYAGEKYALIQQPILAELMKIKGVEAIEGSEVALAQLTAFLESADPGRAAGSGGGSAPDAKTKSGLGRSYAYRAELLLKLDGGGARAPEAAADAAYGVGLGWDRAHVGWLVLGHARQSTGDLAGAGAAFARALELCPNYLAAYEGAVHVAKAAGDRARTLQLLESAIAVHPRSALIREKAFAISEGGNDAAALAYLDELIANPPPEETEAISFGGGATVATLLKAKAAILADGGKLADALAAAKQALVVNPGDDEAESIAADIEAAGAASGAAAAVVAAA